MKVSIQFQYKDFRNTIFYHLLKQEALSDLVEVSPNEADLIIHGPFARFPKIVGRFVKRKAKNGPIKIRGRHHQPVSVYHTIENTRHNNLFDYSIGYDFSMRSCDFRFPYWMESINWSHEGVGRSRPLRISNYFNISDLQAPLGDFYFERNGKCAAFFGQINEPRTSLLNVTQSALEVHKYGPAFNQKIRNSQLSGDFKDIVLSKYSYNLCPENSLYPGYYTEKILESFGSGCLPITWVENNVSADFNPNAFINLLNLASSGYSEFPEVLQNGDVIRAAKDAPLLLQSPSIEPLRDFVKKIVLDCQ
jgi:hypothetical protein